MRAIVNALANRNAGLTRGEILDALGLKEGETFATCLNALVASDFAVRYVPFGHKKNDPHYKLVDPLCIFWQRFMGDAGLNGEGFWQQNLDNQAIVTWRGMAFENVCWNHIPQIRRALGIEGVSASYSAWSKRADDTEGLQIDLLISRRDDVVNMCEVKYYGGDFGVDADYQRVILRRTEELRRHLSPKTSVHPTLITTFGLTQNKYGGVFTDVVTLDDLFVTR